MSEQIFRAAIEGYSDAILTHDGETCSIHPGQRIFWLGMEERCEKRLTNLRPVRVVEEGQIVLDLTVEEREIFVVGFTKWTSRSRADLVAVKVAEQIKAQTKPERVVEPKGFGAIVEARVKEPDTSGIHWLVQVKRDGGILWQSDHGFYYSWDDLINPVLVRDGITS